MEDIGKLLHKELQRISQGEGSKASLDLAISMTQEILEKLYILRYKVYETETHRTPEERHLSVEFEIGSDETDENVSLFSSPTLPIDETEEPPALIQKIEPPISRDLDEEIETAKEEVSQSSESFNEEIEISVVDEIILPESEMDFSATEKEVELNENVASTDTQEVIPASIDLEGLIAMAQGKHPKIKSFNGNYSLKEKISFINELFGGSSGSFGSAVKQIDAHKSAEPPLAVLKVFAEMYSWNQADPTVLLKFIEKVMGMYE
jgi:hypothetical protein